MGRGQAGQAKKESGPGSAHRHWPKLYRYLSAQRPVSPAHAIGSGRGSRRRGRGYRRRCQACQSRRPSRLCGRGPRRLFRGTDHGCQPLGAHSPRHCGRSRRRHDAQRHDCGISNSPHLSGESGPNRAVPCRRGRCWPNRRAMARRPWRPCHRYRRRPGQGEIGQCPWLCRGDRLQQEGLRQGGHALDQERGRAGSVRFHRQVHLGRLPQLSAATRLHGVVRQCLGRRGKFRSGCAGGQGLFVPDQAQPGCL